MILLLTNDYNKKPVRVNMNNVLYYEDATYKHPINGNDEVRTFIQFDGCHLYVSERLDAMDASVMRIIHGGGTV